MGFQKGHTGFITFGDNSTAKVVVDEVLTYPASGMPADIIFTYQEGETNKQVTHPDMGERFPIPEELAEQVFTKD